MNLLRITNLLKIERYIQNIVSVFSCADCIYFRNIKFITHYHLYYSFIYVLEAYTNS